MRKVLFLVWAGGPNRPGRTDLARFRLTYVDKPAGHQLASPADLPT